VHSTYGIDNPVIKNIYQYPRLPLLFVNFNEHPQIQLRFDF